MDQKRTGILYEQKAIWNLMVEGTRVAMRCSCPRQVVDTGIGSFTSMARFSGGLLSPGGWVVATSVTATYIKLICSLYAEATELATYKSNEIVKQMNVLVIRMSGFIILLIIKELESNSEDNRSTSDDRAVGILGVRERGH
ncbi:hypothetical protein CEXT_165801 [Caerostris extrusa]|uniref:Uncharacterized protein n=1 Tax=Caerostris extrusa TaxID=172846 RepID=A0AAV4U0U7_CAEEX|nr:hypothetical protein CEXT_165801 [Caerostris extrusa]